MSINEFTDWLTCPTCSEPTIPPSDYDRSIEGNRVPLWSEDDEATCPGCGRRVVARLTGDGIDQWIEAAHEEEEA